MLGISMQNLTNIGAHNGIIINQLSYCILNLSELQPRHLLILVCSKTFKKNALLKNTCRTGCETPVWI